MENLAFKFPVIVLFNFLVKEKFFLGKIPVFQQIVQRNMFNLAGNLSLFGGNHLDLHNYADLHV